MSVNEGMCGWTDDCGVSLRTEEKPGAVYAWKKTDIIDPSENQEELIAHTYNYHNDDNGYYDDYYSIIGMIHADSQQVMQIHYHALDIQEKGYTLRIAPKIYVHAQLNWQENVYNKQQDRINFVTADGRRNEKLEPVIKHLIETAMETDIYPHGLEAAFVKVK
jgi:hypothetical protein